MSNDSQPTQNPPSQIVAASGAEESKPTELPEQEEEAIQAQSEPSTAPEKLEEVIEGEKTGATASVWNNNKKINALWSINQNRNSWIWITDIGWKKLANNSDSAIVALTILGSHALQTGHVVNVREEAGLVKEIYAW